MVCVLKPVTQLKSKGERINTSQHSILAYIISYFNGIDVDVNIRKVYSIVNKRYKSLHKKDIRLAITKYISDDFSYKDLETNQVLIDRIAFLNVYKEVKNLPQVQPYIHQLQLKFEH